MLSLYANEFATSCILLLYLQSQWIFHQSEVSDQVVEVHCLPVERSLSCMIENEESISKRAMDWKERLETNDRHSAEGKKHALGYQRQHPGRPVLHGNLLPHG